MRFNVAVSPEQNTPDMPRSQVREDGAKIRRAEAHAALFTEIRENGEDAFDLWRGLGDEYNLTHARFDVPIAIFKPKFKVLDGLGGVHLLHQGYGRVPTPARHITWTVVEPRWAIRAKPRIAFVNMHFINAAFSGEKPDTEEFRKELWWGSFDIAVGVIDQLYNDGCQVFVGGDFNKLEMPLLHPRLEWIMGRTRIIKFGHVLHPAWNLNVESTRVINTHADHMALFASLTMRKVS